MARAAGGTSHRLNPGFAMIRSRESNPAIRRLLLFFGRLKLPITETRGQSAHEAQRTAVPADPAGSRGRTDRGPSPEHRPGHASGLAGGRLRGPHRDHQARGHGAARCALRPAQRIPGRRRPGRRPSSVDRHLGLAFGRFGWEAQPGGHGGAGEAADRGWPARLHQRHEPERDRRPVLPARRITPPSRRISRGGTGSCAACRDTRWRGSGSGSRWMRKRRRLSVKVKSVSP